MTFVTGPPLRADILVNPVIYTFLIAAALLLGSAVLAGLGLLVLRVGTGGVPSRGALAASPWVGFGAAIMALQVWHIWLPVSPFAALLLSAAGGAGLILHWRLLSPLLRESRWRALAWFAIVVCLSVWTAMHTTRRPQLVDNGLYHLSSIRWAYSYPIVPGLGNLHGRLAFNSSFFLYAAVWNFGPFVGRAHHLAGGLIFFLLLARSIAGWSSLFRRAAERSTQKMFDALCLAPAALYVMGDYGPSPTPDVAVFVLGMVLASELLGFLENCSARAAGEFYAENASSLVAAVALCALGVTMKLSFAALGVTALALVCAALSRGEARVGRRAVIAALIIGAALLVPWAVRGVILSGYPLYPCALGGFDVPWRIPVESVRLEADWIRSWARRAGAPIEEVLGNWRWLWPWFNALQRNSYGVVVPLGLAVVVAPIAAWQRRGRADPAVACVGERLPLFLLVPLAGLAYWFLTAPEFRFAGSCFWLLGFGSIAIAFRGAERRERTVLVAAITVLLLCFETNPIDVLHPWHRSMEPAKCGDIREERTNSGLVIHVPREGDCWDAPLPCAPRLKPGLRLRVPGDLASGFLPPAQAEAR